MTQALLTPQEIAEACSALRLAFGSIAGLRKGVPGGRFVQFPKIPSILSESWVAQEIAAGRAPLWNSPVAVARGGVGSDLLVRPASPGSGKVEVKATGAAGFQYFSTKDTTTDVLVWVDFARFFESEGASPPTAYWLPQPGLVFPAPCKITLAAFRKRCDGRLAESRLTVA